MVYDCDKCKVKECPIREQFPTVKGCYVPDWEVRTLPIPKVGEIVIDKRKEE